VVAQLGVLPLHFATASKLDPPAAEVTFVQTGVKLRLGEIDALFRLVDAEGRSFMISAEIKGRTDVVWVAQVYRAASSLFQACADQAEIHGVIPMAVKAQAVRGRSVLHVLEFALYEPGMDPPVVSESVIELVPRVREV
jgi:hypothetical protein